MLLQRKITFTYGDKSVEVLKGPEIHVDFIKIATNHSLDIQLNMVYPEILISNLRYVQDGKAELYHSVFKNLLDLLSMLKMNGGRMTIDIEYEDKIKLISAGKLTKNFKGVQIKNWIINDNEISLVLMSDSSEQTGLKNGFESIKIHSGEWN